MQHLKSLNRSISAGRELVALANNEVQRREVKLEEIDNELQTASDELARLQEMEREDNVRRVLEGLDLVPLKPKRQTRINNLEERIVALRLARPVQENLVLEAHQARRKVQDELSAATIPHLSKARLAALEKCSAPLNSLIEALVDTAALDVVQDRLVGSEFGAAEDVDVSGMFRATIMLETFLKALPPRLMTLASTDLHSMHAQVSLSALRLLEVVNAHQSLEFGD